MLVAIRYGTKYSSCAAVDSEQNYRNSDCDDQNHESIGYSRTRSPNCQPHQGSEK